MPQNAIALPLRTIPEFSNLGGPTRSCGRPTSAYGPSVSCADRLGCCFCCRLVGSSGFYNLDWGDTTCYEMPGLYRFMGTKFCSSLRTRSIQSHSVGMCYHRNCHKTPANSSLPLYGLRILLIDNVIGRHRPQHSHRQARRSRFHRTDVSHNVRMGCRKFAFEDIPTHTQRCTTKRCDFQLPCVILPLTPSIADTFLRFVMSRGRCKFMVVERIYVP